MKKYSQLPQDICKPSRRMAFHAHGIADMQCQVDDTCSKLFDVHARTKVRRKVFDDSKKYYGATLHHKVRGLSRDAKMTEWLRWRGHHRAADLREKWKTLDHRFVSLKKNTSIPRGV